MKGVTITSNVLALYFKEQWNDFKAIVDTYTRVDDVVICIRDVT